MFESILQGFFNLFALNNLLALTAGVVVGILLGVTPGLGALLGVSLLLPLVWILEPSAGILMLVGIHAAVMTGGVIPTILMAVPGAPTNLATLADGYPMTQRGEGARALGAALTSSALGGIVGVPMAILMIPVIIPIVLAMGSPEMTLMVMVGLSFLATLGSGDEKLKNMMAGMLGILVSLIGIHPATGTYRFTFGVPYLYDGVDFLMIALGMFGMSELFNLFLQGKGAIASSGTTNIRIFDTFEGVKDVFRHWWLWFRCSVIGYVIGLIPGIGGTISIFLTYGYGQKSSKHPEKWGTGIVEGVIAPEAANNSSVSGSVLTSLALGIPGDSVLALILGAFLILGITPGKELLTEQLPLTTTIIVGVALANFIAVVICFPGISTLTKITVVPYKYLFCIIIVLLSVSSFSTNRQILDVIALIPFGIIGLCMKKFGYSLTCFILGFILGNLFEHYMWLSIKLYGPVFFLSSPLSILLLILLIGSFTFAPIKAWLANKLGGES